MVHLDGKEYMRDRLCYSCGVPGHYARDCAEAWKQHYERKKKRNHYEINMNREHEINTLFNNEDDNYFGNEKPGKVQRNSSMLFKIAAGSEFQRCYEDAKAKDEFLALMDGGAESSVTNNKDLITNLTD